MSDFQKDLKDKWNKLSLFGSKKPKGFKGQGQKLGTADAPKSAVANDRAVRLAGSAPAKPPPPRAKPAQAATPPPARKLGFSDSGASSSSSGGGGGGGGGGRMAQPSVASSGHSPAALGDAAPAAALPEPSAAAPDHAVEAPSEEVQAAVALLQSEDKGAVSAALLTRVLHNIVSKPREEKYRKLRLSNKKVQEELVNVSGGLEFLQAAGFQLVFDEADGYAVFPEDEDIAQLRSALQALGSIQPQAQQQQQQQQQRRDLPADANPPIQWSDSATAAAANRASAAAAAAPAAAAPQTLNPKPQQRPQPPAQAAAPATISTPAAAAAPRDRQTQVLLSDNPATEVSDEVFKRTPADVKAAYLAARKKQELGQMLMTREYRAKLAAGGSAKQKAPTHAVIRVRLPDGLVLQGEFNAGEQVSRIFEWVSDSLRDSSRTYELITPTRRPLVTSSGTLRQAGLLPTSLLNFRWLDCGGQDAMLPALRDSLLAEARPAVS